LKSDASKEKQMLPLGPVVDYLGDFLFGNKRCLNSLLDPENFIIPYMTPSYNFHSLFGIFITFVS
jgi:hypothetical protein